jgi:2-oxo-4-hydroxy-4-carboxy-5-ureidoimidazoline decarboxylase
MNAILSIWNTLDSESAIAALLNSCAAHRWARAVAAQRPYVNEDKLFEAADRAWAVTDELDWMQAFKAHPRIGERTAPHASAQSTAWSQQEQSAADTAQTDVLAELSAANACYEEKFGFTYIVCATGKSVEEMLAILQRRLANKRPFELREAAEQQRQITQLRLRKWLRGGTQA